MSKNPELHERIVSLAREVHGRRISQDRDAMVVLERDCRLYASVVRFFHPEGGKPKIDVSPLHCYDFTEDGLEALMADYEKPLHEDGLLTDLKFIARLRRDKISRIGRGSYAYYGPFLLDMYVEE